MEPENTCCTCYYHDAKSWFCYNGLSPKGTENTDPETPASFTKREASAKANCLKMVVDGGVQSDGEKSHH